MFCVLVNTLVQEGSIERIYFSIYHFQKLYTVFVLGRDKGYTVKYNPLPEGVPEGKAQGNS